MRHIAFYSLAIFLWIFPQISDFSPCLAIEAKECCQNHNLRPGPGHTKECHCRWQFLTLQNAKPASSSSIPLAWRTVGLLCLGLWMQPSKDISAWLEAALTENCRVFVQAINARPRVLSSKDAPIFLTKMKNEKEKIEIERKSPHLRTVQVPIKFGDFHYFS